METLRRTPSNKDTMTPILQDWHKQLIRVEYLLKEEVTEDGDTFDDTMDDTDLRLEGVDDHGILVFHTISKEELYIPFSAIMRITKVE